MSRMATSTARRSTSVSRGGRLGIGVELPLLLLELAGPVDERMGVVLVGDLGLFELARGEPLVFLAQLGGQLGDGLLVFERQLGAAEERGERRRRSAPASAASFCERGLFARRGSSTCRRSP